MTDLPAWNAPVDPESLPQIMLARYKKSSARRAKSGYRQGATTVRESKPGFVTKEDSAPARTRVERKP